MADAAIQTLSRPSFVVDVLPEADTGALERRLGLIERLSNQASFRRALVLVALTAAWELYARYLGNPLIFPTFTDAVGSLLDHLMDGSLPRRLITTLQTLLVGYGVGVALAAILTTIAVSTRIGTDILSTLTAMFNPLPAIALLPLALIWFGLGTPSLVFVIVHSVLWAVALNAHTGFLGISETQRMVGQNIGLSGVSYVRKILIPAALPSIITGLKIGWAFAWRTLIAAELVFGVSAQSGGLGWFIYSARIQLDTAGVFAGLLTVIIIGLFVEGVVFRAIETRTIRRWGMQRG